MSTPTGCPHPLALVLLLLQAMEFEANFLETQMDLETAEAEKELLEEEKETAELERDEGKRPVNPHTQR